MVSGFSVRQAVSAAENNVDFLAVEIRNGKPVEFRPRGETAALPRRAGRHSTDTENYRERSPRPPMTRTG
jgi:hypothetical protein